MASILDNSAIRQAVLPITVQQYHQLGAAGIIGENTELLSGVIIEKMIKSPRHTWMVQHLADWLRQSMKDGLHVRQEQPLTLGDSEPEPDVAVVIGALDDYQHAHPDTAEFVIEVAIGPAEVDRAKALIYAAAGVKEYWLIAVNERQVEVFQEPTKDGYVGSSVATAKDSLSPPVVRAGVALQLHTILK